MSELIEAKTVAEENRQIIAQAWTTIRNSITANQCAVPLSDSNQLFLNWSSHRFSNGDVIRTISTKIGDRKKDFSKRSYTFYEDNDPDVVVIRSNSRTDSDMEGKGYGSGLILLTNEVIEDALKRFSEDFAGKTVIAGILDTSKGQGIDHEGKPIERINWTSYYADTLGYRYDPILQIWLKVYQEYGNNVDIFALKHLNS